MSADVTGRERELPADLFDALERVATEYGGIGGGAYFRYSPSGAPIAPWCAVGCLEWSETPHPAVDHVERGHALEAFGITEDLNDKAVFEINERRGVNAEIHRVPFSLWCAELNVVRSTTTRALAAVGGGG
jgi:hypothetical protein